MSNDAVVVAATDTEHAAVVLRGANGRLALVVQRDVPAGAVLHRELPLACVSMLAPAHAAYCPATRSRLPAVPETPVSVDGLMNEPALARVQPSLEWLLFYALLQGYVDHDNVLAGLPQPGKYAACREYLDMTKQGQPLPHTVRAWLACLLRRWPRRKLADLLLMQGIVARNAYYLHTPLSRVPYAVVLYQWASHATHSCLPTAHVVPGDGAGITLVAAAPLPAGTEVTVYRGSFGSDMVRCLQTAPQWLRTSMDTSTGARCTCSECTAAVRWLRACAGEDPSTGTVPAENVVKVVAAVEDMWLQQDKPETPNFAGELARTLADMPLGLAQVTQASDLVLSCSMATLKGALLLDQDTNPPPLGPRRFALSHALLQTALEMPAAMMHRYGADGARHLVEHCGGSQYVVGGKLAVIAMLQQQGASKNLTARRAAAHEAHASWLAFAALASCAARANHTPPSEATKDTFMMGMLHHAWQSILLYYSNGAVANDDSEQSSIPAEISALMHDLMHAEAAIFPHLASYIAAAK